MFHRADIVRMVGRGFRAPPLRPLARLFFRRHVAIIFYHGVWPKGSPQLQYLDGVDLDSFRSDMTLLSLYFRFVSLDEVLLLNERDEAPREPAIAVCFDDGFNLLHPDLLSMLEEFRISATVFVITGCVDNQHLMWFHKFAAIEHLRGAATLVAEFNRVVAEAQLGTPIAAPTKLLSAARHWPMNAKDVYADAIYDACDMPPIADYLRETQPYMTWDQLRAWLDHGHHVGLHTRTHPCCSGLDAAGLHDELVAAADEIRERLAIGSVPFAYPFGDRLPSADVEREVCVRAQLSCMLGIGGLSRPRTELWRLERVDAEAGLDASLFGRPLLRSVFPKT
jgi:peptidoglycan/xylan/chitin deacetylase (PgdA/CDA1 family)